MIYFYHNIYIYVCFWDKCTQFVGIALIVSCGSCGSSMDKQMIRMEPVWNPVLPCVFDGRCMVKMAMRR